MKRLGIFCFLILSLTACSQFQAGSPRRVFLTDEVFVSQTTDKDNLGFRKINRMKPLLYKKYVIQANGVDGVAAYDNQTGEEKWKLSILNGAEPSAALIKNRLFIGASDGQLYSIDAENGKVLWTFPTRVETLSEPLLHEGILYLLTGNNSLYALDASTGKQLWFYSRQDPSSLSIRGGSKPALRNGTLYVGFSDGSVVAFLAQNGAIKWEKLLNRNKKFRDLDSDPLVEGDFLYILGYDDQMYCLRAASGEEVWRSPVGGYGSILATADRLYYAGSNNEFLSINKETGQKVWSFPMKEGIATSASFYKGLVIFGESQGALRILDAGTGKEISRFFPGRGILSPPTVDEKNRMVYFISNEANLYGLRIGWSRAPAISYLR
ncbi:MAG: PQQ-binding-like beta-propeller repeat protein [Pseudobdellovibrionaceae bacterium]